MGDGNGILVVFPICPALADVELSNPTPPLPLLTAAVPLRRERSHLAPL